MNRRTLLASLGTLTAGGLGITGSGAFTSTTAARGVSATVETEDAAYLQLTPNSTSKEGGFADDPATSNKLVLDFNGSGNTPGSGGGLNPDSTYTFDRVFQISNQGTQTVYAYTTNFSSPTFETAGGSPSAANEITVSFYYEANSGTPLDGSTSSVKIPVGNTANIGVRIVVPDGAQVTNTQVFDATLTADSTDPSASTTYNETT